MSFANTAPPASSALRRGAVPLLIFGLSVVVQVASLPRTIDNLYDEGLVVFGAQRVLEGDIPYRDFWSIYGPGQFYALAGLFSLFGSSVWIEQLWDIAVRAAVVSAAFLWARKLAAGAYAYLASFAILLLLAGVGFHGFPIIHALLFGLISGYVILVGDAARQPIATFITAGFFAGLAALFRHDIGFYFLVAEALALVCQPVLIPGAGASRDYFARRLLLLALGALIVVAPVSIWLLMKVPLQDLWISIFYYPATSYPAVRSLPFPELPNPLSVMSGSQSLAAFSESLLIYFPLAVGAAAVFFVLSLSRTKAKSPEETLRRFGVLLLGLITLLVYLKGVVRVSSLHLLQSIIPATVLFFVLAAQLGRAAPRLRFVIPVATIAFAFAATATHASVAYALTRQNWQAVRPLMPEAPRGLRGALAQLCAPRPGLERARCFEARPLDAATIEFLYQRTNPEEPIFVGTEAHDRIFVNNIMLYFLAARRSATKWHQFDPGVQNADAVQREIIQELAGRNVRYLVLSSEWANVREPNASANSSGVLLLDGYIRENFTQVQTFGPVAVWERKRDAR